MTLGTDLDAALRSLASGDVTRALPQLEALALRDPENPVVHNALGSAFAALGRWEPAAASFARALALRPGYVLACTNLGSVRLEQGEIAAARALFDAAIAEGSAPAQAYVGLARTLCLLGQFAQADATFERALTRHGAHLGLHSQRCYAQLLDPNASARSVIDVHCAYAGSLGAGPAGVRFDNDRSGQRKLVLGYVSADFREHSVASFLEPILAAHDPAAVTLHLYSDAQREDATSARLFGRAACVRRSAQLTHAQLSAQIRADAVDVLIDLAGHMQPNRLPMFFARPAPVLLTYLGYPGSTGLAAFDGRISDAWADPSDDPDLAGPEPVLRVPGGCYAYQAPSDVPDVAERVSAADGGVTFGCFNDALKLNGAVFALWAQILTRTPGSRLLLKARLLASHDVAQRIRETLRAAGVDPSRLELLASVASRNEHLASYARIDIALDPFPYAGATTSCEALYMGVPVVTLAGDRHASRLGASLLCSAGLEEFVTHGPEAYRDRAVQLASDEPRRAALRRSLRSQLAASALCDGRRVAGFIESSARTLFARWAAAGE
jgi:predicted O-linked N-acetylglucosamine transferase (SPINDLY family)